MNAWWAMVAVLTSAEIFPLVMNVNVQLALNWLMENPVQASWFDPRL